MKNQFIGVIISLIIYGAAESHGQDLTLPQGQFYFKPSFAFTAYDKVYDNDGIKKDAPSTTHSCFHLAAEAGIYKNWNLLLNAPLYIMNQADASNLYEGFSETRSNSGPGDIEFGLRYGFPRRRNFYASFSLFQSIGTGKRDDEYNLNTGFADFNNRMAFAVQYKKVDWWALQLFMAFNNRNKGFSDEFHAGALLRLKPLKNTIIDIFFTGIEPLENGSEEPFDYQLGLYHNNSGSMYGGIEARYEKEKGVGYFASAQIPVKGQYIYASPVFRGGFTFRFQQKRENQD